MTNKFCVVGILSNEAPVIDRFLKSFEHGATSFVISVDTKSTDATASKIVEFMAERSIPGKVIVKEWINYSENRTYNMEQARIIFPDAKYFIWHDGDEVFLTNPTDTKSYLTKADYDKLYDRLELQPEPMTYITTHFGGLVYHRKQIARNNQPYKWMSPKHEYLTGVNDNRCCTYNDFILLARKEGSASKDPNRCIKDSKLFLDYMDKNGGPTTCPREVFYLGQEYDNYGDDINAIKWYELATTLTDLSYEYRYLAHLRIGRITESESEKIKHFLAGHKIIFTYDPNGPGRLECIHELMFLFMAKADWATAFDFGMKGSEDRTINAANIFVETDKYKYFYDFNLAVCAYHTKRYLYASALNARNLEKNKNSTDAYYINKMKGLILNLQALINGKLGTNSTLKYASS